MLAAAAALESIAWAVIVALFWVARLGYSFHELADTFLYLHYAELMAAGKWPYVDFPVEYPPLAVPLFLLPPHDSTVAVYERWFSLMMIGTMTLSSVLTTLAGSRLWRGLERPVVVAAAFATVTLAGGALAANRYDAVVALVLAGAVLALTARRPVWASGLLGLGFALKFTPAILLPLVLLTVRGRRTMVVAAGVAVLAAAAPFGVLALHSPDGLSYPFRFHAQRPLQIESVLATPYLATALLDGDAVTVTREYGSQNLSAPGTRALARLSPLLLVAGVGLVYAGAWRTRASLRASPDRLPEIALAVVLVAMCASKVLSPQFLVWTYPLVALCIAGRRTLPRISGSLCLAAVLLTQIEFPHFHWRLVALDTGPLLLVSARNAVLLAAAAVAVVGVWREGGRRREEAAGHVKPAAVVADRGETLGVTARW